MFTLFQLCVIGYGVFLAEFTMNQSFDLALRQLASVMLKKYVEDHWGNDEHVDGTPKTIVATNQAKDMIRKILPNGLYDAGKFNGIQAYRPCEYTYPFHSWIMVIACEIRQKPPNILIRLSLSVSVKSLSRF